MDTRIGTLGQPGHYSFEHAFNEDSPTPNSPVPNFPAPSPSWSESSTTSAASKMPASRSESVQSNQGSVDGRSHSGSQPSTPRTDDEPIYMNLPLSGDVQRERDRDSSSPTPPPPVRRFSVGATNSQKKSKTVARGMSSAMADRVSANQPHSTLNRGREDRRSKEIEHTWQSGQLPSPSVSRKPPPVNKKPRPEQSKNQPAKSKPAAAAVPADPSSSISDRQKFEQTRAGIAGKIAMFQYQNT